MPGGHPVPGGFESRQAQRAGEGHTELDDVDVVLGVLDGMGQHLLLEEGERQCLKYLQLA